MVVDDDEDCRFITALSLRLDADIEVTTEPNGKRALALLSADEAAMDCILLDSWMPDMDGVAVLSALRELPRHAATPVVFLTASVGDAAERHYHSLGAQGVIAKPFDPLTLAKDMRRLIGDR